MPQTVNIKQAAEIMGVNRRTIYGWLKTGLVEHRRGPNRVRIVVDSLLSMEKRKRRDLKTMKERLMEKKQYPVDATMLARIMNNFTYHAPKNDQQERYRLIRDTAKAFALLIVTNSPPSREQSVALTNLEQVVFNVNAAIARNE
jgi:hypothetical protein